MAKLAFYTKPSCTTCRNARTYLEDAGVELDLIDINLNPPSRAFLEEHVDDERKSGLREQHLAREAGRSDAGGYDGDGVDGARHEPDLTGGRPRRLMRL